MGVIYLVMALYILGIRLSKHHHCPSLLVFISFV